MVDAEDGVLGEDVVDDPVELDRRLQVVAERLLDHDAAPLVAVLRRQPGAGQLLEDDREGTRRDRQVERVVAARAAHPVEVVHRPLEPVERVVVVEGALDEPEALGEPVPDRLPERGAGVLLHRVVDDLAEVLRAPVAAGETGEGEARREQAAVGQVVDRGHQLLARQVAGDSEDHQPARAGDTWQALVPRVA